MVLIFTVLFAALFTVLISSNQSWRIGRLKLAEQQQARQAMDNIARLLRQSSPNWVINGTDYPVTITSNNRLNFYQPVFDEEGNITTLRRVVFRLNPADNSQLLRRIGIGDERVVANNISSINFGGGCAGCSAYNCPTVAGDCPAVKIDVRTSEIAEFILSSKITLRNANISLSESVTVEEPPEGEF